jgi:hypothetical protein
VSYTVLFEHCDAGHGVYMIGGGEGPARSFTFGPHQDLRLEDTFPVLRSSLDPPNSDPFACWQVLFTTPNQALRSQQATTQKKHSLITHQ